MKDGGDYISREAAINRMFEAIPYHLALQTGLERAINYLLDIPAADVRPVEWIPVSERLPDVFKHVLVNIPGMSPHPTVQEAFREKNGMWYSNGFRYGADEVTHWMPLPEPPKEGTDGT